MTTCRCLNNSVVVARCLTKENLTIAHSRFGPGITAFSFPGIREWKSPGIPGALRVKKWSLLQKVWPVIDYFLVERIVMVNLFFTYLINCREPEEGGGNNYRTHHTVNDEMNFWALKIKQQIFVSIQSMDTDPDVEVIWKYNRRPGFFDSQCTCKMYLLRDDWIFGPLVV